MAYEVDNLEIKIKSQADETVTSLNILIGKLAELKGITTSAFNGLNNVNTTTNINTVVQGTQKIANGVVKTENATKKLSSSLTSSFAKLTAGYLTIKTAYNTIQNMTRESINYTENLNLFTVSMGQYYGQAMEFQNRLHEAFGTNMSDTLKYQGLFMQMASSMGLASKQSYLLSENFTKLGNDLSSLYNISIDEANTKLKAGMAGQAEPLRSIGIDITEASLRPIAEQLGVDSSVRNMTQAEKVVLRYIAIIRQAGNAQGDFARTIESPANQLKIMKQQLAELGRAIANTFMGVLGNVLPYINAFIMALREVFTWLGTFTGYDPSSNISNIGAVTSGVADDLGSANDSAKALKDNLQGFDEINLLDKNTGSGGGGSSGGSGVNPALLNAMSDYDNLMSKVQMKATGIKDKIMEWLGFTKNVNEETGEVTFAMENFDGSNLELIRNTLIGIGIAIVTLKTLEFITWLSDLGTALTSKTLVSGLIKLGGLALMLFGAFKVFEDAKDFFNADNYTKEINAISGMLTGLALVAGGVFLVFGGVPALITLIVGLVGLAVVTIVKHFNQIIEAWTNLGHFIMNSWTKLGDFIIAIFLGIVNKWRELGDSIVGGLTWIGNGIVNGFSWAFNGVKNIISSVWNWIKGTIGTIGTFIGDTIGGTIKGIINGVMWAAEKAINGFFWPINMAIGGLRALPGLGDLRTVSVSLPRFAEGGFPEDGMFMANHNELVGKFTNGKTAVANNGQIIAGIEQGVYKAVSQAMSNQNTSGSQRITGTLNGKNLIDIVIDGVNGRSQQNGSFAFDIV